MDELRAARESALRAQALDVALAYYLRGLETEPRPQNVATLRHIVFQNWLEGIVQGGKLPPLVAGLN